MLTAQVFRNQPPEDWDGIVERVPGASAYQTSNWATLVGRVRGSRPLFLTVEEDGCRVAQCLVLKEGFFSDRIRRSWMRSLLLPAVNRMLPCLNWLHGPLLLTGPSAEIGHYLIDKVEEVVREEGVLRVGFVQPPFTETEMWETIAKERGYTLRRCATYLVDIRGDFAANYHRSVHKNVRKCGVQGVTVSAVIDEELPEFYHLVNDFRARAGLVGFSFEDFMLHVCLWGKRRHLFAARHEGRMIAGLGVLLGSGLLIEVEAADSPICRAQGIFANDLLKYEIMKWGWERGFTWFDLAGVAPEPRSEKEANIRRFKSKFGGEYVEYPSFHRWFGPAGRG